jgi:hypothetical protein
MTQHVGFDINTQIRTIIMSGGRLDRPTKITFADMREAGVRGLLIYCADCRCSHSIALSGDAWPDELRLSDIEARFICSACGMRGTEVRPDFNWNRMATAMMGYR